MQVYWTGPGIDRQLIPNSAFNQTPPPPLVNGLNYRYYEGSWTTVPNFDTLTPVKTGNSDNVDLGVRTPGRNDNFGLVWEGYLNVSTPGIYTFETISDDGSKVYFNSTYNPFAAATVDNDGVHAPRARSGSVDIPAAGLYPVAITFFERDGGELMRVFWTGPGFTLQLIPASAFFRRNSPSGVAPEVGSKNERIREITGAKFAPLVISRVYPNPFRESFRIDFYNNSSANNIHVGVYDIKGRLVYTQHAGTIAAGNVTLSVNLNDPRLPEGTYLVRIDVNGVPSKMTTLLKTRSN